MRLLKRILGSLYGRSAAERSMPDRTERWRAACALLDAGSYEIALEEFAALKLEERRAAGRLGVYRYAFMDPARVAAHEPYVGVLDDALVETGHWIVIQGDRLYHREAHGRMLNNSPLCLNRVDRAETVAVLNVPEPVRTIDEPCVLLGGDDNYAHWVLRNLLKLCLVETDPALAGLRLLVNDDLFPYQREFLSLLGIGPERLIPVPRGVLVRCRRLWVPTHLRMHKQVARGVHWLRDRLCPYLAPAHEARDLLFISRRDARWRRIVNEDELLAALAPRRPIVIDAGRVSVREQISAFSRACIVVGAHGAGFANQVFAPLDAGLVELGSTRVVEMGDFRHLAAKLGQHVETLRSEDYAPCAPGQEAWVNRDYRIDPSQMLAALARVEARRGGPSR